MHFWCPWAYITIKLAEGICEIFADRIVSLCICGQLAEFDNKLRFFYKICRIQIDQLPFIFYNC